MNRRHDDEAPILITQAAVSYDEEFAARKKRYSLIMACRIPCLLLAGLFGIAFNWPLVAVAFIVLSVPLPWVAVLIANDRPPRKAEKANRYQRRHRELDAPSEAPVSDAQIIEAAEALDARERKDGSPTGDTGDIEDTGDTAATRPRTGTDG